MRTPLPDGSCHQWRDVALLELVGRRSQQVLAGNVAHRDHQRHHVLQLIPEAKGAAGLIERGPGQDPAGERLIEQPLVDHQVEGAIGGLHPQGPEDVVPSGGDCGFDRFGVDPAIPLDQGPRLLLVPALTQQESHLDLLLGSEDDGALDGRARVECRPRPIPTASGSSRSAAGWSTLRCRPRNSERSQVALVSPAPKSAKATLSPKSTFQGLRASKAPVRCVAFGDDLHRRDRSRRPEHPFDIGGHRQAAPAAGQVAKPQARNLDRVIQRRRFGGGEGRCPATCARIRSTRARGGPGRPRHDP